jgi:hypothetical protein
MAGVQCLKRLYWQVHEPELGGVPDAAAVAIMEQGREVGKLARQLFAGGVEVPFCDPEQAIRITRELIANPDVPAIFEAAFENGGVFVRVVNDVHLTLLLNLDGEGELSPGSAPPLFLVDRCGCHRGCGNLRTLEVTERLLDRRSCFRRIQVSDPEIAHRCLDVLMTQQVLDGLNLCCA